MPKFMVFGLQTGVGTLSAHARIETKNGTSFDGDNNDGDNVISLLLFRKHSDSFGETYLEICPFKNKNM